MSRPLQLHPLFIEFPEVSRSGSGESKLRLIPHEVIMAALLPVAHHSRRGSGVALSTIACCRTLI